MKNCPAPEQPEKTGTSTGSPPAVEKTKGTLTVASGRFNPPTGHEKLLDTVAANSDEGDYHPITKFQIRKRIH